MNDVERMHNPIFPPAETEPPQIVVDYQSPSIESSNFAEGTRWWCKSPGRWNTRKVGGMANPFSASENHPTIVFRDPVPGDLHVNWVWGYVGILF